MLKGESSPANGLTLGPFKLIGSYSILFDLNNLLHYNLDRFQSSIIIHSGINFKTSGICTEVLTG